jgi:hypothetical protein
MAIFDISHVIVDLDGQWYRERDLPSIHVLIDWLEEHVGQYYGVGDRPVLRIGSGWEIIAKTERDADGYSTFGYLIDITDEQASIHFALRWL